MAKKSKTSKSATPKVPSMKDLMASHRKLKKARKLYEIVRDQASARKKEWAGALADLEGLLEDVEKGQARLFS